MEIVNNLPLAAGRSSNMQRLTLDKPVKEMGMVELAHNSCYAKDRNAWYRGFETEIGARDFIRELNKYIGDGELPKESGVFDDVMTDWMQYNLDNCYGIMSFIYTLIWSMANLYERLKEYENTGLEPDEILSGVELANIYAGVRKAQECYKETEPIKCIISKKMMCCNLADLFSKCDGILSLNHSRYIVNTVVEAEFKKRKAELYVGP